jgi:hypothetical protein
VSRRAAAGIALGLVAALGGCTGIALTNREPARELARLGAPPGSVYTGWRVFQDKCAGCHGADADGSSRAPDLLPRVRAMGLHRFVGVVLQRYDWGLPAGPARGGAAPSQALVESVAERREGAITMPPWQGEPRVNAHVADLYAWLSARAEGTQGPGRPAP